MVYDPKNTKFAHKLYAIKTDKTKIALKNKISPPTFFRPKNTKILQIIQKYSQKYKKKIHKLDKTSPETFLRSFL
jgi:hypothetical protein